MLGLSHQEVQTIMKKTCLPKTLFPLLGLLLLLPTGAVAQESLPDRFKIDIGAFFVTDINTTVSLAEFTQWRQEWV